MYTMLVNLSALNDGDFIDALFPAGDFVKVATDPTAVQGEIFQGRVTTSASLLEWNANLQTAQAIAVGLENQNTVAHLTWLPSSDNTRFARAFFCDYEAFYKAARNIKRAHDWSQYRRLFATYPILLVGANKSSRVESTRMVQLGGACDAAQLAVAITERMSQFAMVVDEFEAERVNNNKLMRNAVRHKIDELDWFVVPGDPLELMHVLYTLDRACIVARSSISHFIANLQKGMEIEYALTRVMVGIGTNLYGTSRYQVYARDSRILNRISMDSNIEFWI